MRLSGKLARASGLLNLLLRGAAEKACLDDDRHVREVALSEAFEVAMLLQVKNRGLGRISLGLLQNLITEEGPELVDVDGRAKELVPLQVVAAHTDLTKVSRVELVHEGPVVVLATGVTTTTGVAAVLSDTAMSSTDVSALLAVLVEAGGHLFCFPLV